jgi:hypothetical protein
MSARVLYEESLAIRRELGEKLGIATIIAGLAELVRRKGQTQQAAQLLGAVEALLQSIGAVLERDLLTEYERTVSAVQAALGAETFAQA